MGLRIEKVKAEFEAWWEEVVVFNGPRYRNPREWVHLYVDWFGASFEHLHYSLGHWAAVTAPFRWTMFWVGVYTTYQWWQG